MCDPVTAAIGLGSVASGVTGIIGGNKAADAQEDAARRAQDTQLQMFETQRQDFAPWRDTGENALAALRYEFGLGARPEASGAAGEDAPGISRIDLRDWESIGGLGYQNAEGDTFQAARGTFKGPNPSFLYRAGDMAFRDRASARSYADTLENEASAAGGAPNFNYRGFRETPGYEFRLSEGLDAIDQSAAARGGLFSGATAKASQRFGEGLAAQEYDNYLSRLGSMAGIGMQTNNTLANLGSQTASNVANAQTNAGQARASGYANMANSVNSGISNALGGLAMGGYLGGGGGGGYYGMSDLYSPSSGLSLP